MVSHNVSRILQDAQSLSDAEREELRLLLANRAEFAKAPGEVAESRTSPITRMDHSLEVQKAQALRQALVKRGLLSPEPPRGIPVEELRSWKPISIRGKPLSETIIEERR